MLIHQNDGKLCSFPNKTRAPHSKFYAFEQYLYVARAMALRAIRTAQAAIGTANTRLYILGDMPSKIGQMIHQWGNKWINSWKVVLPNTQIVIPQNLISPIEHN